PHLGYANNMYGLINAFLVALLTESAFLVKWHQIFPFIQEPLVSSFNRELINLTETTFDDVIKLPYDTKNAWEIYKDINSFLRFRIPARNETAQRDTLYAVRSNAAYFFELCASADYQNKLLAYNLVSKETV